MRRLLHTELGRPGLVGAVTAAALLVGCSPEPPVVIVTPEPLSAAEVAVAGAREELAGPLVELARIVTATADDLDALRHDVPRGAPMGAAIAVLEEELGGLAAAAEALADVAEPLLGEPAQPPDVVEAAGVSAGLAGQVRLAVAPTRTQLALLSAVVALDEDMAAVPPAWDARGSQSQRREALARLELVVARLAGRVTTLPDSPAGCDGLAANRARWVAVLGQRTRELASLARTGTGDQYDLLRERYRRAPYGEDRAVADAATRPCWEAAAPLPGLVSLAQDTVVRVEELLQA